jgi:large subunit ribosomal protein L4
MPSARRTAGPKAPKLGGGNVNLDAGAFTARFNMPLVHESVRAELAARRRGTAATKTRGQVSGGGEKPWRQKGTGRARAGSNRSPLWTGGGVVFGPSPRSYTFKINRKERRAALRSALSLHAERDSLAVFDAGAFDAPSTAQAVGLLNDWDPAEPILIVLGSEEAAAGKSFRNIARAEAIPVGDVGVADIVGAASLLISETALPDLVARAAAPQSHHETEPAAAEPAAAPKAAAPKATATPKAAAPKAAAPKATATPKAAAPKAAATPDDAPESGSSAGEASADEAAAPEAPAGEEGEA